MEYSKFHFSQFCGNTFLHIERKVLKYSKTLEGYPKFYFRKFLEYNAHESQASSFAKRYKYFLIYISFLPLLLLPLFLTLFHFIPCIALRRTNNYLISQLSNKRNYFDTNEIIPTLYNPACPSRYKSARGTSSPREHHWSRRLEPEITIIYTSCL